MGHHDTGRVGAPKEVVLFGLDPGLFQMGQERPGALGEGEPGVGEGGWREGGGVVEALKGNRREREKGVGRSHAPGRRSEKLLLGAFQGGKKQERQKESRNGEEPLPFRHLSDYNRLLSPCQERVLSVAFLAFSCYRFLYG